MSLITRLKSKLNPSLLRLVTYLKPHRGKIAMSIVFMIGAGAASSLIAMLLGKLTDVGFYDQEAWIVVAAPIALIFISVLHGGSMFMSNYLLGKTSQAVLVKLRGEIFHKILRWPAATYQKNSTGNITSKFIFEANVALSNASKSCIILVRDSVQVVALTCVLVWNNWMLAIVSLIIAPMIFKLLRYISKRMKTIMETCQASFASVLERVKEVYEGHRLVKLSDTYALEMDRFKRINDGVSKMMIDMTKVTSMGTPLTQLIFMSGVALVLAFAMFQISQGVITMGNFVTFLAALLLLMPPLRNLAGVNSGFVMMAVAAESIFATLDEADETDEGKVDLTTCKGDFVFEHVSMRYPNTKRDAVHEFNLEVKAGDCIALVGLSGSGKSTLVHMIPRFWNPTKGRILLDGIDIRDLKLESLRRHIAIVSQDVMIFDDTIRNNVLYGSPDATEAEVWKALEDASLADFVRTLPEGLDTVVGEGGSRLSGGQKQRLSIARAFLRNAPILILDEATSALDSENEMKIKGALVSLMKGRTTFMVAHRFSTIEHATKIVAMADGVVKEMGTRAELLEQNGLFAELLRLQSLEKREGKTENNNEGKTDGGELA
ncbi:MAG: lipid A export permease/ATP-binding protein MsbA [Sutterella sp. 63_29]|nr:MAG: lipid A export permease/ATP-binding protein MsbA [Sutterella sp. 63_29]